MAAHEPETGVAFEKQDVNVRAVSKLGVAIALAAALAAVASFGLFRLLSARERRVDPPRPPLSHDASRLPPEPRLQTRPAVDLTEARAQDEQVLRSYGWVDKAGGVVRIPIDEAIRIYAGRAASGQATAPSPAASPAAPAAHPASPVPGGRH